MFCWVASALLGLALHIGSLDDVECLESACFRKQLARNPELVFLFLVKCTTGETSAAVGSRVGVLVLCEAMPKAAE